MNLPTSSSAGFDLVAQNAKLSISDQKALLRRLMDLKKSKRQILNNKKPIKKHCVQRLINNAMNTNRMRSSTKALEKGMNQLKGEVIAKMGEYQNKQQQNTDALTEAQKKYGLTPQNQWDSAARHKDLALSEPDRLIVKNKGNNRAQRSVFAEQPIPNENFGIFYYEVTILGKKCQVSIGIGTKRMPLNKWVGRYTGTYAYSSWGSLWSHDERHDMGGQIPSFCVNDVIGCGVNLATRQIFYTKNGRRLGEKG
uniref:B30.2/SPRY domain-containing protein n=1 Tax=Globodera pallida TaxID=36090 RepID=A0A183C558_GLOPA